MDPRFLLRGLVLGLAIAAPVGPIGVLCIRRTLADGRAVGFVSGLGAATVDAFYGAVAAFGLAFISDLLLGQQRWIRLLGGAFLCYLGLRTFLSAPAQEAATAGKRYGLAGAYASTVVLTLTNPATILSFVAVFAGLGLARTRGDSGAAGALVLGVFLGSALWWLTLSGGVSLLRARLTPARLRWVNRVSGSILLGFGLLALASVVR
ncbi:MAG: LysE family transporter [Ktedonobacterales bacterium]|nr:LysE family transporter [Ktedonobacterales bacterium]